MVTINWGDGTNSTGTVIANGTGGFTVMGVHNYASPGAYTVATTITPMAGSPATVSTSADIGDAAQRLVAQMYLDLLGRPVDAGGLALWAGQLNQGTLTAGQVVATLTSSQEYLSDVVNNLHLQVLGQPADAADLASGVSFLSHGGTDQQLEATLFGSTAYFQNQGGATNSGFLSALYMGVLHRSIDPGAEQFYSQQLSDGLTRTEAAATVIGSGESENLIVNSLYQQYLHRAADSGGLSAFSSALQSGAPTESVIVALVGSSEYAQKVAGDPNQLYVQQLYVDLLHRSADSAGLAHFTAALDSGAMTRQQLVDAILGSAEYRSDEVESVNQTYLSRPADTGGLALFTGSLAGGASPQQVAEALVGSAEFFQNSGGDNDAFLHALFQDALGRDIDPQSLMSFDQLLLDGTSRADVTALVFSSSEYLQDLVDGFYTRFLRRTADVPGMASFVGELQNGANQENVIASLTTSAEYFGRL
jgi:hypothetical protein